LRLCQRAQQQLDCCARAKEPTSGYVSAWLPPNVPALQLVNGMHRAADNAATAEATPMSKPRKSSPSYSSFSITSYSCSGSEAPRHVTPGSFRLRISQSPHAKTDHLGRRIAGCLPKQHPRRAPTSAAIALSQHQDREDELQPEHRPCLDGITSVYIPRPPHSSIATNPEVSNRSRLALAAMSARVVQEP